MSIAEQFKKISKDTFSYGFSSALQKLITMFLFPIYARLLSPTDFGIQDVVLSVVNIMVMFLVLGMDSAVMQYYYENDNIERKKIVSTYLWFQLFASVPTAILISLLAKPICGYFFKDPSIANYLRLGIASVPFSLMSGAMMNTLRLTFQTRKFVILSTTGIFLQVILAIIFVIVFKMGISGVFLSILISYTLQALLGFFLTYNDYSRNISFAWLPKLLKIGIPLVPAALSFWIMSYANRFFLVKYDGMEEVGLLSVVNRISSILLLFLSAFSTAWGPYAYNLATDKELARVTFGKIFTLFLLFSLTAALGLSLFSREIIIILASSVYVEGSGLVIVFSVSSVLWGALYIVGIGTGVAKKNHHYTISVIIGALVSIALNYFLIPLFGVAGAAYASLFGNLFATIYMYYVGQQYLKVVYDIKKLLVIVVLLLSAAYFGIYIDKHFPKWDWHLLIFKIGILVVTMVLLVLAGVVSKAQILQLFAFLRKQPVELEKEPDII